MPTLALCLCSMLVAWLLLRDVKRRRGVSSAVWIPVALLLILGSRPVSLWLAGGGDVIHESGNAVLGMGNEASTSVFDQLFYFSTLAGSFVVASARKVKWSKLFAANTTIIL